MIPFDVIAELFTIATESWGSHGSFRVAPPTASSVARIERELGIAIPPAYIELAMRCPSYGGWLAGIGEDYDHPYHMLHLNAVFHVEDDSPALPPSLVLLNHGHDGDCDCWDTAAPSVNGEHPIVYVSLESAASSTPRTFGSFLEYIEDFVVRYAAANPTPALAARVKELTDRHAR